MTPGKGETDLRIAVTGKQTEQNLSRHMFRVERFYNLVK